MARHSYDKAMYRLTTILTMLGNGERVRPPELAQEFGVTVRTIQKDLFERLAQLPIERQEDGSYLLTTQYRLATGPRTDETIVLELLASLVGQVHPDYRNTIKRILRGQPLARQNFHIELGFEDLEGHLDTFYLLKKALDYRQSLQFRYTTKHGKTGDYRADPYRLANFDGFWYLMARDCADSKLKTYYLKSMENVRVSQSTYSIDQATEKAIQDIYGTTLSNVWFRTDRYHVTLKAKGDAMRYISRNPAKNMEILEEHSSHLLLRMTYHRDLEVLSFVKRWIPDITIEDNPQLEQKLFCQVEMYLEGRG